MKQFYSIFSIVLCTCF